MAQPACPVGPLDRPYVWGFSRHRTRVLEGYGTKPADLTPGYVELERAKNRKVPTQKAHSALNVRA